MGTYRFYVALNENVEPTETSNEEFNNIIAIPTSILRQRNGKNLNNPR